MTITDDPMYLEVAEALNVFKKRAIDRIEAVQRKQKECKIKDVIESKMVQEMKTNAKLKSKLAELTKAVGDLDRVCADFASGLTISERDTTRLDTAKEMLVLGKKLTGVSFDLSAPPSIAKGYIRCERERALATFEFDAQNAHDALWDLLDASTGNDENRSKN